MKRDLAPLCRSRISTRSAVLTLDVRWLFPKISQICLLDKVLVLSHDQIERE
jgi:hypothetical protein